MISFTEAYDLGLRLVKFTPESSDRCHVSKMQMAEAMAMRVPQTSYIRSSDLDAFGCTRKSHYPILYQWRRSDPAVLGSTVEIACQGRSAAIIRKDPRTYGRWVSRALDGVRRETVGCPARCRLPWPLEAATDNVTVCFITDNACQTLDQKYKDKQVPRMDQHVRWSDG